MTELIEQRKPRRHKWDQDSEKRFAAEGNRLAYNEKICMTCHIKKLTIHPPSGFPWNEWVTAAGTTWTGDATPPCLPQAETLVVA